MSGRGPRSHGSGSISMITNAIFRAPLYNADGPVAMLLVA